MANFHPWGFAGLRNCLVLEGSATAGVDESSSGQGLKGKYTMFDELVDDEDDDDDDADYRCYCCYRQNNPFWLLINIDIFE